MQITMESERGNMAINNTVGPSPEEFKRRHEIAVKRALERSMESRKINPADISSGPTPDEFKRRHEIARKHALTEDSILPTRKAPRRQFQSIGVGLPAQDIGNGFGGQQNFSHRQVEEQRHKIARAYALSDDAKPRRQQKITHYAMHQEPVGPGAPVPEAQVSGAAVAGAPTTGTPLIPGAPVTGEPVAGTHGVHGAHVVHGEHVVHGGPEAGAPVSGTHVVHDGHIAGAPEAGAPVSGAPVSGAHVIHDGHIAEGPVAAESVTNAANVHVAVIPPSDATTPDASLSANNNGLVENVESQQNLQREGEERNNPPNVDAERTKEDKDDPNDEIFKQSWPQVKRGEYQYVYISEGPFAGKFGYYDDVDDSNNALIYFGMPLVGDGPVSVDHSQLRIPQGKYAKDAVFHAS